MKLLTTEEIREHQAYTLKAGAIGTALGLGVSALMFRYLPRRYASFNPKKMTWSVKTTLFITPPTLLAAIFAEEGSNRFDALRYSGDYHSGQSEQKRKEWESLTTTAKVVTTLSEHKYKIITSIWAASLYASWVIINRDKIMTGAQKAVQARMYAQFITVVLLLASLGLTAYEKKLEPNKAKKLEDQRWEKALQIAAEEEVREREGKNETATEVKVAKLYR